MKRLLWILALCSLLPTAGLGAEPQKRSQNIVYIDGTKYYIHTVGAGETPASIARLYGVSEAELLSHNATLKDGLREDQSVKIPFKTSESVKEQASATQPQKPLSKKEEKALKKSFSEHFVAPGETLYAISRRYEISVETLMEDNPDADPAHLSIGQKLLIRKKAIGRTDEKTALTEMERYEQALNRASTDDAYRYHVVQPKETIYSLARRYKMTEQELITLNHLEEGLKAGAILRIPKANALADSRLLTDPIPPGVVSPEEKALLIKDLHEKSDSLAEGGADTLQIDTTLTAAPREVILHALAPAERLKVALLLPLSREGRSNSNFAAFYQGFLLGLEEVKTRGFSVDVTLYDTERNRERVELLLSEEQALQQAHLIVGPIYPEGLEPVVRFAEERAIPVVLPMGSQSTVESDVLFCMAPSEETKYEKLTPLFDEQTTITLIRTGKDDPEFEQEILRLIGERSYQYHDYQSVQGAEHAERSDLTPLLKEHDKHLLFVLSNNEVDVDRILASLASAQTNMQARSQRVPEFTVVGHSRWNRYSNIDRTTYFKNRVVLISNFHAKRDNDRVREFDSRYLRHFGALPTLYAYRGYETARIFCPAMFSDIEYDMEGRRYNPLQTYYTFEQREGSLTHINREWVRVNYNPDFTITIE